MRNNNKLIIALDGPSAAGKGTIGQLLSVKLNLKYFQSSIVYRNLASQCFIHNIDFTNIDEVITLATNADLLGQEIDNNNEDIAMVASKVAVIPEVRVVLNKILKQAILENPRILMEGRDIGTVIAPEADIKIFITANLEVRALRRYNQLLNARKECIFADILQYLKERDERDSQRKIAPLNPAQDAIIIDSSELEIEEVIEKIMKYYNGIQ